MASQTRFDLRFTEVVQSPIRNKATLKRYLISKTRMRSAIRKRRPRQ